MTTDTPEPDWDEFRRLMPVTQRWVYMDHAAVAPLPQPAVDALRTWAEDIATNGDVNWGTWRKKIEDVRKNAAALLNADAEEIALIRNTTEGVSLIAEGYPWKEGDNVVVPAAEFPSNRFPWQNLESRGVELRMVETPDERLQLSDVQTACDGRTRIIAVSWVGYATGWRNNLNDLADIAHRNGSLLFVDGIQGLGVLPLDVKETPIDFLAADGHKWLLGPEGAGVLFVRQPHLEILRPLGVGWNSVKNAGDYSDREMQFKNAASRYEGGSYCMGNLFALNASINLLQRLGVSNLSQRLQRLTDELVEGLHRLGVNIASSRESDRRSGIVSFSPGANDPRTLMKQLRTESIVVNCRGGKLRVSPHGYNTTEDCDRVLDVLKKYS